MLRGLFFDLDGTLIDREAAFSRYLDGLTRRFPFVLGDPSARRALALLDQGGLASRPEFCAAVVQRFPGLCMDVSDFWADFGEGLVAAVGPAPPRLLELLACVAPRYKLAVVSNGGGPRQRTKLDRAGLARLFEQVFVSGELGWHKPDPRIFEHALAEAGLQATEVLFVGDDPARDIAGAAAVGMATCWISRGRPYPPGLLAPSRTAGTVEELLVSLLGAGT